MSSFKEHHDQDPQGSSSNDRQTPPRSTPGTPGGNRKKRVGFHVGLDGNNQASNLEASPERDVDDEVSRNSSVAPDYDPLSQETSQRESPSFDGLELTKSLNRLKGDSTPTVLKSALRKGMASRENRPQPLDLGGIDNLSTKMAAQQRAHVKAAGLERDVASAPGSRTGSPTRFGKLRSEADDGSRSPRWFTKQRQKEREPNMIDHLYRRPGITTGQNTPDVEELEEYFPRPKQYRAQGLSAQLLYQWWNQGSSAGHSRASSASSTPGTMTPSLFVTPPDDEVSTPSTSPRSRSPWSRSRSPKRSDFGIGNIVSATASSTALAGPDISTEYRKQAGKRPESKRSSSAGNLVDLLYQNRKVKKPKSDVDIRIKKHIQETTLRKRYILKLCRALMAYGAPTHRLEAYLMMTSRVLAIDADFLYFPGTMIVSFDDAETHTTEMKLVRVVQGVDFSRMKDTHSVYKDVTHDLIGVQEGMERLESISKRKDRFPVVVRILAYGLGTMTVAPFAFGARLIDLPPCFALGLILGSMQLYVAPKSDLYTAVFEIVATILTSCISRALGSIRNSGGGYLFCFSALAQSSIALILPGFVVLCAALELQSRAIVAGSVRIVFAVVYSFWIGYGLTIGTAIYGAGDPLASSESTCQSPLSSNPRQYVFLFVPAYALCLCIINNAKWKQMPMMIVVAVAGYQVNYWASKKFPSSPQICSTFGAAAISVLANGYSRLGPRIDQLTARTSKWVKKNIAGRLCGHKSSKSSADPGNGRRKSSIAESLIGLLPAPLRPRRLTEKEQDIEGNRSSEEEEPKPDVSPGTASPTERDEEPRPDILPGTTLPGEWNEAEDAQTGDDVRIDSDGNRIGRDGKPKKVNYVLAAAIMLPAIFVQVPSGISVSGSLISGISAANAIVHDNSTTSATSPASTAASSGASDSSFAVATTVVEVAIGITIGLYFGSLIVYPRGKGGSLGRGKRSGLFTF